MTENLFVKYPDFITSDPRRLRKDGIRGGYNIDEIFQFHRHNTLLPKETVVEKRVLDLGSCVGATGAWVLENGAARYVGVELQNNFCSISQDNLTKIYPNKDWDIKQQSFNDFFLTNTEPFDIVVAFGVLYDSVYFENLIKNILNIGADLIVVESIKPQTVLSFPARFKDSNSDVLDFLIKAPIVEYSAHNMVSEVAGFQHNIESAVPSRPALQVLMSYKGYELVDQDKSVLLEKLFPNKYQSRYSAIFKKTNKKLNLVDFESTYQSTNNKNLIKFNRLICERNE